MYWCCKYTVKVFTRKSWWDFFNRDFRFGPFWPYSAAYTPTLNLENSSEHSRPATHFKAYEILNVAYCFLFVIFSTVQKIWAKTYVNSAFFGFFGYFRPLNVIFRDSPTELPLILKLIKF